jgi:allophanate hydrolase
VTFEAAVRFAVTGGGSVELDGDAIAPWQTVAAAAGQRLTIGRPTVARFRYLAVSGGIVTQPTLGSRSTYLPTGIGGLEGRPLRPGDRLPVGGPEPGPPPGTVAAPVDDLTPIRVTGGPQSHLFPAEAFAQLAGQPYRVAPASDRMGTRLDGSSLALRGTASLPSEPTCLGAIQVPDDGRPIVILQDGPTVGGYPKIGAVAGADLARFGQLPLGGPVEFRWISVAEAGRALAERRRTELQLLASIGKRR